MRTTLFSLLCLSFAVASPMVLAQPAKNTKAADNPVGTIMKRSHY
jgi:hypothetical protein